MDMKKMIIAVLLIAAMSATVICGCDLLPTKQQGLREEDVTVFTMDEYHDYIAPTPDEEQSKYFDSILCSGGGYSIVSKRVETLDKSYATVGVIDDDNNWIIELTADSPILANGELPNSIRRTLSYLDNGVFFNVDGFKTPYEGGIWNIKTNKYTDMGTFWLWENDEGDFEFVNDYIMGVYNPSPNGDSGYAMLIDKEGNVKKTDINCRALKYLSYVSEGLFFAYDGFYDTDGNKVIDLSEYAGRIENRPEFHDGKAEIEVSNPSGVRFHATIDKNGTFLSDFEEG